MCFRWWQYHEAATVIQMAYTIEERVLSENLPRLKRHFERLLAENAAPGSNIVKQHRSVSTQNSNAANPSCLSKLPRPERLFRKKNL
jgi:hypothetical protein